MQNNNDNTNSKEAEARLQMQSFGTSKHAQPIENQ